MSDVKVDPGKSLKAPRLTMKANAKAIPDLTTRSDTKTTDIDKKVNSLIGTMEGVQRSLSNG